MSPTPRSARSPRFQAHIRRLAPGLELAVGACRDFDFRPHAHDEVTIGRVVAGEEVFNTNGNNEPLGAGGYYMTNSGDNHAATSMGRGGWYFQSLYIDADRVRALGLRPECLFGRPHPKGRRQSARVSRAFNALLGLEHEPGETASERPASDQAQDALGELVAALHDSRTGCDHDGQALLPESETRHRTGLAQTARAWLIDHHDEPVEIADLAARLGVSSPGLIAAFQRAYGTTPGAFLTSCRVNTARGLLRTGMAPGEAAIAAGFYDQSHMHRHFRRIIGLTPGRYRQAWRDNPGRVAVE